MDLSNPSAQFCTKVRAIVARYMRQLICQTRFTGLINATLRRRSPCSIHDVRKIFRFTAAKLESDSRPILISHCSSLRPRHSPRVSSGALWKRKKSDEQTRKSYFLSGGRSLWGYRDCASRAIFHFEFSKHRTTFDRVYAEKWPAVKQQATDHTWATIAHFEFMVTWILERAALSRNSLRNVANVLFTKKKKNVLVPKFIGVFYIC